MSKVTAGTLTFVVSVLRVAALVWVAHIVGGPVIADAPPVENRASTVPHSGTVAFDMRSSIDPMSVDLFAERKKSQATKCSVLGGYEITQSFDVKGSLVDGILTVRRDSEDVVEIQPKPRTSLARNAGGVGPTLACDSEVGRFYYAHPVFGYVVAYNVHGRELWRRQLPRFRQLDLSEEQTALTIMEAMLSDTSRVLAVVSGRGSILVEYKTGDRGNEHVVYHRSGAVLGRIPLSSSE